MILGQEKHTREKGNHGEDVACYFLMQKGFLIVERNYLKKWGEIDIVAAKKGILHFIEVKSVYDSGKNSAYRPEDNVHELKIRKLRRIIDTYLIERHYGVEAFFEFHVITVRFDSHLGRFYVRFIENIIL